MKVVPKILVIDDNPTWLRLASLILSQEGYFVLTAHTGKLGLELAQTQQPDVLLLDVMMPDISGVELCRQLRAQPSLSRIRIMGVTAAPLKFQQELIAAGADGCMQKPINGSRLASAVKELLYPPEKFNDEEE